MPRVRLVKEHYSHDIEALREEIRLARKQGRPPEMTINLVVGDETVELTMQLSNLYIVAFKGKDRRGRDQVVEVGELCGENYNNLGMPSSMGKSDMQKIGDLASFKKGDALDTKLITFAAIVVSEACRFMAVSMHIQGLLSGVFSNISLTTLDDKYFTCWSKHTAHIRSGVFVPGEQVMVEVLL